MIWEMACAEMNGDLFEVRSGVAPGTIKQVHCETHMSLLLRNITGCAITHAALQNITFSNMSSHFDTLGNGMKAYVKSRPQHTRRQLKAAKDRYAFIRQLER